jgi:hypothetical protein
VCRSGLPNDRRLAPLRPLASLGRPMQNLSDDIRLCYARAAEAKERADQMRDPEVARSYEFGERLDDFTREKDHLEAQQQSDGWPIDWTPPGAAAVSEWRGITTVKAVRTLRAYGRL